MGMDVMGRVCAQNLQRGFLFHRVADVYPQQKAAAFELFLYAPGVVLMHDLAQGSTEQCATARRNEDRNNASHPGEHDRSDCRKSGNGKIMGFEQRYL